MRNVLRKVLQVLKIDKLRPNALIMTTETTKEDGFMDIVGFRVFPWSISGLETSVVVHSKTHSNWKVAFDMGYSSRPAMFCENVFISHGHMDHISGIPSHASKRELFGLKPATYYMPKHLVQSTETILEQYGQLSESEKLGKEITLHGIDPGEEFFVRGDLLIRPFPTEHRITSQGYILYEVKKTLKKQYVGMSSDEIRNLKKQGVEIHNIINVPEVAFTGDTTFQPFKEIFNPDLLKVKLLIMETTYITEKQSQEKAHERGHCHLQDVIDNAHLFEEIEALLLIHFSDMYSTNLIKRYVYESLPDCLKHKVFVGTVAQDRTR